MNYTASSFRIKRKNGKSKIKNELIPLFNVSNKISNESATVPELGAVKRVESVKYMDPFCYYNTSLLSE